MSPSAQNHRLMNLTLTERFQQQTMTTRYGRNYELTTTTPHSQNQEASTQNQISLHRTLTGLNQEAHSHELTGKNLQYHKSTPRVQNPHGINLVQTTETLIAQSFSTGGVSRLTYKQGPTEMTRYGKKGSKRRKNTPTKKNLSEETYAGTEMSQGPNNQKLI